MDKVVYISKIFKYYAFYVMDLFQAVMLVEGHMDDGITFSRAQEEESRSARVIRKCQSLFNRFNKYVFLLCSHYSLPLIMISFELLH